MNAKRLASGIIVTGILGVALLAGIGPYATTAEAAPRKERVTQRSQRPQKVERQKQTVRRETKRDMARERRTEAVRDRKTETRREVNVQHRGIDTRQRRVETQHRRIDTHHYRVDRRVVHRAPVRVYRPWYRTAPRFYVDRSPFYFCATLGIYLGGLNLDFALTDACPEGYVYVDPYCNLEFWTVTDYRYHLHRHHHRPALRLVQVGYCGN